MNAIVILAIALAASLFGNWWLYDDVQDVNKKLGETRGELRQVNTSLETCNSSVDSLDKTAKDDQAENAPKIEVAKTEERQAGKRAQAILVQQPVDPNNGCKSAAKLARDWIITRQTK